jgi:nitroreductase
MLRDLKDMASLDIDAGFREGFAYPPRSVSDVQLGDSVEDVIRRRRSVRVFDPAHPVPADVIRQSLTLAMLSPNSSNLQPWEFYWVRSPDTKAQLARLCMSQPAARTASDLLVLVSRTRTWRRNSRAIHAMLSADASVPQSALDYYRLACPLMYTQAGNLFSLVKQLVFNVQGLYKPIPREPNFRSGMHVWAIKSVCLAASTFMLAVAAKGYDTCPMEGVDQVRVKRLLHLPRDARVVMVIAAGRRAANGVYGERIRLDESWFVKEV